MAAGGRGLTLAGAARTGATTSDARSSDMRERSSATGSAARLVLNATDPREDVVPMPMPMPMPFFLYISNQTDRNGKSERRCKPSEELEADGAGDMEAVPQWPRMAPVLFARRKLSRPQRPTSSQPGSRPSTPRAFRNTGGRLQPYCL